MAQLIEKLRELLERPTQTSGIAAITTLDDQSIERLMVLLCVTRDDELSCEEVFNCLDEYVDCLAAHSDLGDRQALVDHHLGFCADCRDELNALVNALQSTADDRPN
mgnify:CR=1 FL=1